VLSAHAFAMLSRSPANIKFDVSLAYWWAVRMEYVGPAAMREW